MLMFFGISPLKAQRLDWVADPQVGIEDEIMAGTEVCFSKTSFMGT
jgi:hypothetical protein